MELRQCTVTAQLMPLQGSAAPLTFSVASQNPKGHHAVPILLGRTVYIWGNGEQVPGFSIFKDSYLHLSNDKTGGRDGCGLSLKGQALFPVVLRAQRDRLQGVNRQGQSPLTPKCSPATSLACHQDWHKGPQQLTRGQAASLLISKVRERVSRNKDSPTTDPASS